jgi:uncharacterized protein (DUF58 family)
LKVSNFWQRLKHRVHQQTLKRLPLAKKVQPGVRSIYVLPSRQGWMFLLLVLIIWLLGTNYQNNLILAAAFMLISLHFVSLFHVWRNVSGLVFEAVSVDGVFVKERAAFMVRVSSKSPRHYRHLRLTLMSDPPQRYVVDIPAGGECRLQLEPQAQARGQLPLPAVRVETSYPFGLVNCWTWIRLKMSAVVFPQPVAAQAADSASSQTGQKENLQAAGDDFYGFAAYQAGAPLSRVAWKHYARGAGLHLKEFGGAEGSDLWIDWQSWKRLDMESCLSAMCFQVLEQSKAATTYGVRLPDRIVAPGSGESHKLEALTALAFYGQSESLHE